MNRPIANLLMAPYYYGTLPFRWWSNARRNAAGLAPIIVLFYHRVADDCPNSWTISNRRFYRQIRWLRRHFPLVSLEEAQRRIASGRNDRPVVSITFDDGYADNSAFALPLLIRYRIPFTYFVSVYHVQYEEPFAHDVDTGRPQPANTLEELRALAKAGVEIGLHTRTHCNMAQVRDPHQLYDEVVTAGSDLAGFVGRPVRYFAFPYGLTHNLSRAAFQLAHKAGYLGVCSAYGGYNFPGDDPFHIQRFHADPQWCRWKNCLTIDPRKIRNIPRYEYESARTPASQEHTQQKQTSPQPTSQCPPRQTSSHQAVADGQLAEGLRKATHTS